MGFSLELREFSLGSNCLKFGVVPWDSEIFGFTVVEVTSVDVIDHLQANALLSRFEAQVRELGGRVVCVKLPLEQRELFTYLQHNGYVFVEETIRPYIGDLQRSEIDYNRFCKYPLLRAGERQIRDVQDIARQTFRYDRFHLDKNFPWEKASERYATWVKNSFGQGEDVLYLDVRGEMAGFSILSTGPHAYLGLIGLADKYKGKGLGMSLFAGTCRHARDLACRDLTTTMSLNNLAALNQYSACGFKFKDPAYVLHKWV